MPNLTQWTILTIVGVFWVIGYVLSNDSFRAARGQPIASFKRFRKYLLLTLISVDTIFAIAYFSHPRDNGLLIIFLSGNVAAIVCIAASRLYGA